MSLFVDHSRTSSCAPTPIYPPLADRALAMYYHKIKVIRKSEVAWVVFTLDEQTKPVVIKVLCNCKDTRYSLATIAERQRCQLEAVYWNRMFTQNVHIGLARLCDFDIDHERIGIGEIIKNPTKKLLNPHADYVLLMHKLPKETRLDYLLEGNKFSPHYYIPILTKYMAHMHTGLRSSLKLSSDDCGNPWGSAEQLKKKLLHNCDFVNQPLMANEDQQYNVYYKSLQETFRSLKDDLLCIFDQSEYQQCFEQRRLVGYIRRCHGDLKARNIWIAPYDYQNEKAPWKYVSALDAIDFNPMYSNIDILSDFAMLVVDVQARTHTPALAKQMIEEYLLLTNQQDEVSKAVLAYYLVEKALVGAIVNIIYDNWPTLGLDFLDLAKIYMQDLRCGISFLLASHSR